MRKLLALLLLCAALPHAQFTRCAFLFSDHAGINGGQYILYDEHGPQPGECKIIRFLLRSPAQGRLPCGSAVG